MLQSARPGNCEEMAVVCPDQRFVLCLCHAKGERVHHDKGKGKVRSCEKL